MGQAGVTLKTMKRYFLPLLSVLAACLLPSCFQNETVIQLNKDGSGTLTEETAFGPQALEMLAQFAQLGGDGADPLADLTSEEKAKTRATELGEGVTLDKVEKTEKNGFKGGKTTFRFADINKLKLSSDAVKDAMPEIPGAEEQQKKKTEPITFQYDGGKLTIKLPEPEKAEAPAAEGAPEIGAAEEAQAKAMFKDMRFSVKIVAADGIAETNAEHVDGGTITLVDMDFGKVLEKPGALQKMSALGNANPDAAMQAMKGFDGVKIETKREVTVTLK